MISSFVGNGCLRGLPRFRFDSESMLVLFLSFCLFDFIKKADVSLERMERLAQEILLKIQR